jgi:predicted phage baseplate assembly protein
VIDRATGRIFFGDGVHGKIPPAGAAIMATQSRTGGGRPGNVAAREINQLLSAIPGIEKAFNPRPAEGGANSETLRSFSERGPKTFRHDGRAITASDCETMAYEASAAVAVARVMPNYNGVGGSVRLMIIPHSHNQREPQPSFGLREQVREFIASRAPFDLAQADQIYVVGPNYLPIEVTATIVPIDAAEAGAVEKLCREALAEFFHPVRGGPESRGWEPGRDVFLSDIATVLERVQGVDHVEDLAISLEDGDSTGETVAVPDDRIAAAGKMRLSTKAATK